MRRLIITGVIACSLLLSCTGSTGSPTDLGPDPGGACTLPPDGSANPLFSAAGKLTAAPLSLSDFDSITALGNMQVNGHPTPTDHMYFMLPPGAPLPPADGTNVYAAADATVYKIMSGGGEDTVTFKLDQSFYYYYGHIHAAGGLTLGQTVTAGDVVGTNSGLAAAVDFGVIDHNMADPTDGFANPCRWNWEMYRDSPLKYFSGTLSTDLYAKVNRQGTDKDGTIANDVVGELVGNWVTKDLPESAMSPSTKFMSFVYDVIDPSKMRISIGGTVRTPGGVYGVQAGAADFKSVTTASGKVAYQLYDVAYMGAVPSLTQTGLLLVQMTGDPALKVEFFPGTLTDASFDSSAFAYVR